MHDTLLLIIAMEFSLDIVVVRRLGNNMLCLSAVVIGHMPEMLYISPDSQNAIIM